MLTFQPFTIKNAPKLRKYYQHCDYLLCEYAFGTKLMWKHIFHPTWTEVADCLVIRNEINHKISFDFPIVGVGGSVEEALDAIGQYCIDSGIPLAFNTIPENQMPLLLSRYPKLHAHRPRVTQDYLYPQENLASLSGRKFSGQRNHINKFRKHYPQAFFRPLTRQDAPLIAQFWQDYEQEFTKTSASAKQELQLAKRLVSNCQYPWFSVGGILCDGKLIGLSLGEQSGKTLIIHIEKALYSYEGIYPMLTSAFADCFGKTAQYLNREDDAGDMGLRRAKSQYHPLPDLGRKYYVRVDNELSALAQIPTLHSQRLTLAPLREVDKTAYNALCLDDNRNRYWGYDYRQDLHGDLTESYFLQVAEEDFRQKRCVNFAIRLGEDCIGEAVFYRFDFQGGAELGCRIAEAFAGNGYGREAFATAAHWGLYQLGLQRIVAKCYLENEPSRKMLSSCMLPTGKDDTFYYFEKTV